jgi:alpha-ketoglutarate-dependent taurine dioxygenase
MEELSVAFKWESGDVMFVNNFLALHARNDFIPPR